MKNVGKNFLVLAGIVAAGSLGTNALLWNRYTPSRAVLRFGDGNAVTRGAYQTALESADASGDTLNNLLLSNTYDPMAKSTSPLGDALRPVSNLLGEAGKKLNGLTGRILQVADVDMPMPRRVRKVKAKRRVVPKKRMETARVKRTPKQTVAGVRLRPNAPPPVTAMDTSKVAGKLRPGSVVPAPITSTPSFAGPGAVEPVGVIAGFPASVPGATVFSQTGPGAGLGSVARVGGSSFGSIAPYLIGSTALVGAIVANNGGGGTPGNSTGGNTTGGTGGTTTGGTGGPGEIPPVPEPAPVAFATILTLGVAGLMVRARRKMNEA